MCLLNLDGMCECMATRPYFLKLSYNAILSDLDKTLYTNLYSICISVACAYTATTRLCVGGVCTKPLTRAGEHMPGVCNNV